MSIQAQKLRSDLHADNTSDFVTSKGWLPRFQRRHGIAEAKINGTATSAAINDPDEWLMVKQHQQP